MQPRDGTPYGQPQPQGRPAPALVGIEAFALGGSNSPAVLATFTVRLGRAIRVHGVRLMQGRQGGEWIAWPQRKDQASGTWSNIVDVPDAATEQVRDLARAAYDQAAASAPQAAPQRDDLDDMPF